MYFKVAGKQTASPAVMADDAVMKDVCVCMV